jgi:RhoGAP domain
MSDALSSFNNESEKITTINDLNWQEFIDVRRRFVDQHKEVINKNLGSFASDKLKQNLLGSVLMHVEEIHIKKDYMQSTKLRFSKNKIEIPKNLEILGDMIYGSETIQKGIFRINSTKARVRAATTLLYDMVEMRVDESKGKSMFKKNFDLIDTCETYKQLLKTFNTRIIPKNFIPMILAIEKIQNYEEKIVCTKAFVYLIPTLNRKILENTIFLAHTIAEKSKRFKQENHQMDIEGISTVMMPNIILGYDVPSDMNFVLTLVGFNKFIFKEFKNLIKID